ncbi:hypothetical protein K2P47_03905 [Patescibacteria group bacterium]|nr:hypothetical protein [Patescibacteria group bacterium]
MKQYIIGGIIGLLLGTLFGLSAAAHSLFVTGVSAPTFTSSPTAPVGEAPYVVEELEFIEGVPTPDPATIPPPSDDQLIIQPGD